MLFIVFPERHFVLGCSYGNRQTEVLRGEVVSESNLILFHLFQSHLWHMGMSLNGGIPASGKCVGERGLEVVCQHTDVFNCCHNALYNLYDYTMICFFPY